MSARRKARKRALDVLFEAEQRGLPLTATLADRLVDADPPVNEYTVDLVEGVARHLEPIDAALTERAAGWTLDRMPAVDRGLLRIAAFEILYVDDVPDAVAINEAVDLATLLSTSASPSFVNGLLGKLVGDKPTLARQPSGPA
jgi:transcription antitermination protein NusB